MEGGQKNEQTKPVLLLLGGVISVDCVCMCVDMYLCMW